MLAHSSGVLHITKHLLLELSCHSKWPNDVIMTSCSNDIITFDLQSFQYSLYSFNG